jgi:hypothetical protein
MGNNQSNINTNYQQTSQPITQPQIKQTNIQKPIQQSTNRPGQLPNQYSYQPSINQNVALNKMYYDEQDRLEQGNALNSYFQFNTVNVIPPAPKNMNNLVNLNSRHIPVNVNADEIYNRESNVLREEWNKKQRPQINNVNLPNASIPHYNIDPTQLSGNKQSIPRPELDSIQKILDDNYRKYRGISSNERRLLVSKNITITEIDPLYILEKRPNITLTDLEQTYNKLRNIHHPDKGGDADTFIRIQNAISICKSTKCGSVIDKSYSDLRNSYQQYVRENDIDDIDRTNQNNRFSLEKFNKEFNEHRYRDELEEHGYGEHMIKSQQDRDDINIQNTIGNFKLNTFNDKFKNNKKKDNKEIVPYQVPESLDASDGIGHLILGGKQERFTSSIKSRVNYTDYLDAYTKENVLVDETGLSNKINKPYKKALKEYKNASLELTDEQIKAIEEHEEKKKKEETIRLNRFNQMTLDYQNYEKKMSNLMLK